MTFSTNLTCFKCNLPIFYNPVYVDSVPYHPACSPNYFWPQYTTTINYEFIRQIIREELDRQRVQKAEPKVHRKQNDRNRYSTKKQRNSSVFPSGS